MWWIILIAIVVITIISFALAYSGENEKSNSNKRNNYHKDNNNNYRKDIDDNYHNDSTYHLSSTRNGNFLSNEEYKGHKAEINVGMILVNIAATIDDCHLLNNVIIPSGKDKYGNQRTVEIDHILFTPSGLFVIETKSRAGTIFGEVEDDDWYQVLGNSDQIEHSFFNPIKQNDIHIRALKRLLRKDNLVCHSCIVFEDGYISNIDSEIVITPNELTSFIMNRTIKRVYNAIDLNSLYTRVLYYKEHPIKTIDEHIQEVHINHDVFD